MLTLRGGGGKLDIFVFSNDGYSVTLDVEVKMGLQKKMGVNMETQHEAG
jgi:hypothetical protein